MRREGNISLLGDFLLQLIVLGIAIILLFPFSQRVVSGEVYESSVYAADSSLLAEAVHAVTDGELQVTYVFPDKPMQLKLHEDGFVEIIHTDLTKAGVKQPFSMVAEEEVIESVLYPAAYAWSWKNKQLTVEHLPWSLGCDVLDTASLLESWGSSGPPLRAESGYKGLASASFAEALSRPEFNQFGVRVRGVDDPLSRGIGSAFFTVLTHDADYIAVRYGNSWSAPACHIRQRLPSSSLPDVRFQLQGLSEEKGIVLVLPKDLSSDQLNTVRAALVEALVAFFLEGL